MKSKIYSISFRISLAVLLLFSISFNASAQSCQNPPDCILNPTMVSSGGGDLNPGSTNMNDWYYSHGTPSIGVGYGPSGQNALWMWSYESKGEGVYACYNFQQGHTYRICFWAANTGTLNLGTFNVFAANGLTQPGYAAPTNPLPAPSSSELIDNSWTYNTTWTQVVLNYTPTANFNQVWFYPWWTGISSQHGYRQMEIMMTEVHIFEVPLGVGYAIPCDGNIVLNAHGSSCVNTKWFGPSGTYLGSGTVIIPHADPSMNGLYTMQISSGDCSAEVKYQVMVQECNCDLFEVNFDWNGQNPINFFDGSSGPGSSVAWFWEFGDGATSNLQNPSHMYANSGTYTVCLTVIRKVGNQTCCKRICREIQVQRGGYGKVAEPSPEGNTDKPALKLSTNTYRMEDGINSTVNANVSVLPNPATEQVTVTVKNLVNPKVSLVSMAGKTVATGQAVEKDSYLIQLQKLPAGVYVVEVKSDNGTHTVKLIKE